MSPATSELKATLKLAWPIMGAQLLILSMVFTDNLMVARLGEVPLAALAIGGTLYSVLLILSLGILSALSPTISQAYGGNRPEEIGRWVRQGWRLALILAAFAIALLLNAEPILRLVGQKPDLSAVAAEYLSAVAWGVPAQYLFICGRQVCEATSDSRPSVAIAAIGALANVALDYSLIYGNWGMPALGVKGAGFATSGVQWTMFLSMVVYLALRERYRAYRVFARAPFIDWRTFKELFRIGLPISGGMMTEMLFFAGATLVMGWMGSRQLATHQIALNASAFTFMVPLGLSFAVAIRVGQRLGRGDECGVRLAGKVGFWLTLGFQSITATLFLFFPSVVTRLYTSDPQLALPAQGLLRISGVFQIFDGFQVVGISALRGLKDTKIPFLNTIIAFWLVGAPAALTLAFPLKYGPAGVWYGMVLGLGLASLLHVVRFLRLTRIRSQGSPASATIEAI